ncbi:Protein sevenless [Eumeta japonica]|uniref:Protein sevenless n=1 Tax=Eumeta variegata TaxID=151549 RepID=A0A4C1TCT5_EUMVA|nr:Protein sevenless [Eumeta japonica]
MISFREIEWCWKLKPLMATGGKNFIQPLPQPLREPLDLQATLSSTKAKISWQPPLLLEGIQTKAAWQQWDYELDILDVASNNAFYTQHKSEYFQVERLQPSNLYQLKVRATFAGLAKSNLSPLVQTDWSKELIIKTWPMGDYNFLWAATDGVWESQELLEPLKRKALAAHDIKSMKQVNTSLYYVDNKKYDLKCFNLVNPEVLCGFEAHNVYSVDYDWRGGQLYWSDTKRNCVIRADLKGVQNQLLPIFGPV